MYKITIKIIFIVLIVHRIEMIQSIIFCYKSHKTCKPSIYLLFLFWENSASTQIPWLCYYPIPHGQQDDVNTETS